MSFEHFDQSRILELWQTGIALGLADPTRRSLLLGNVNKQLVGRLALAPDASSQLLSDLNALNVIRRLATGEVPIEMYLRTAVFLTSVREEAKVLQSALDEVSAKMSGNV